MRREAWVLFASGAFLVKQMRWHGLAGLGTNHTLMLMLFSIACKNSALLDRVQVASGLGSTVRREDIAACAGLHLVFDQHLLDDVCWVFKMGMDPLPLVWSGWCGVRVLVAGRLFPLRHSWEPTQVRFNGNCGACASHLMWDQASSGSVPLGISRSMAYGIKWFRRCWKVIVVALPLLG